MQGFFYIYIKNGTDGDENYQTTRKCLIFDEIDDEKRMK